MELAKNFEEIIRKLPYTERAIVLSIRPEWIAKILNGEKTLEIRRTAPKHDLPIDVYIYCTKGGGCVTVGDVPSGKYYPYFPKGQSSLSGKIVAKFTLKNVEKIIDREAKEKNHYGFGTEKMQPEEFSEKSCLTTKELCEYIGRIPKWHCGDYGYAWEISDLEIFDEPKELSEFKLKRAPQSFGYVIVLKNRGELD